MDLQVASCTSNIVFTFLPDNLRESSTDDVSTTEDETSLDFADIE